MEQKSYQSTSPTEIRIVSYNFRCMSAAILITWALAGAWSRTDSRAFPCGFLDSVEASSHASARVSRRLDFSDRLLGHAVFAYLIIQGRNAPHR